MLAFAEAVQSEYMLQIASQKRAVLQRIARHYANLSKTTHSAPLEKEEDLWDLVNDISLRSHALYDRGVAALKHETSGVSDCQKRPLSSVVLVLHALLQDISAFDMMMDHWKDAGGALGIDTIAVYSQCALMMPTLCNGKLVDSLVSDLRLSSCR